LPFFPVDVISDFAVGVLDGNSQEGALALRRERGREGGMEE